MPSGVRWKWSRGAPGLCSEEPSYRGAHPAPSVSAGACSRRFDEVVGAARCHGGGNHASRAHFVSSVELATAFSFVRRPTTRGVSRSRSSPLASFARASVTQKSAPPTESVITVTRFAGTVSAGIADAGVPAVATATTRGLQAVACRRASCSSHLPRCQMETRQGASSRRHSPKSAAPWQRVSSRSTGRRAVARASA